MIKPPVRPSFAAWQRRMGFPIWATQPQHKQHRNAVHQDFANRAILGVRDISEGLAALAVASTIAGEALQAMGEAYKAPLTDAYAWIGRMFDGQ